MKPSVYLETSVISYCAAESSRDIVLLGKQTVTRDWWENHLSKFQTFLSPIVLEEIQRGNPKAASSRINLVKGVPLLGVNNEIIELAKTIYQEIQLPQKAQADAYHIAIPSFHQIDFLLTWNCSHIANPFIQRQLRRIIEACGYQPPVICTPQELLENEND